MFVDICFEESIARAVRRDQSLMGSVEAVRERYSQRYIPWQRLYLERRQPMELADVVIDNNNVDAPVLLRCAACGDVADCG